MKPTMIKLSVLGLAAILQGMAMTLFLFPHNIPSGGAAGISILLDFLAQVPYGYTLWILNAGLLLLAVKWLGKASALWTIFCVTVTSITIEILSPYFNEPLFPIWIDLVLGACLFGIGVGILFRMGASSGGMDIIALIFSKIKGYPPGKVLFVINGSILLLTGIIIDWKVIVYAIVCQWLATRMLDFIYRLSPKGSTQEAVIERKAS